MGAPGESPTVTSGTGPISRMVAEEAASIRATYDSVRAAWDARALPNAAQSLAWLSAQLEQHMRWEEESLFEELELRADLPGLRRVRKHHLGHESLARELESVLTLMARRQGAGSSLDDELELALSGLERSIQDHAARELDDVCCPLDNALGPEMVETIRSELVERGRVHDIVTFSHDVTGGDGHALC